MPSPSTIVLSEDIRCTLCLFAYKSIRYYSEDDSPVHVKTIRCHGIEANFGSKTPYS